MDQTVANKKMHSRCSFWSSGFTVGGSLLNVSSMESTMFISDTARLMSAVGISSLQLRRTNLTAGEQATLAAHPRAHKPPSGTS
eukprot:1189490-Prorocentrum_minimum.AAC.2